MATHRWGKVIFERKIALSRRGKNWFNPPSMNVRISFLLSLVVWASAAAAWSQDVPPPLPAPAVGPACRHRPRMVATAGNGCARPAPSQPVPGPHTTRHRAPILRRPAR